MSLPPHPLPKYARARLSQRRLRPRCSPASVVECRSSLTNWATSFFGAEAANLLFQVISSR